MFLPNAPLHVTHYYNWLNFTWLWAVVKEAFRRLIPRHLIPQHLKASLVLPHCGRGQYLDSPASQMSCCVGFLSFAAFSMRCNAMGKLFSCKKEPFCVSLLFSESKHLRVFLMLYGQRFQLHHAVWNKTYKFTKIWKYLKQDTQHL